MVRLACHLFTRKGDLEKFLKQCSRELHLRATAKDFVPKNELVVYFLTRPARA